MILANVFDSILFLRFAKINTVKDEFYRAKKLTKISDVNVDNIVISKLVETENNSKYLIGYFHDVYKIINFDIA